MLPHTLKVAIELCMLFAFACGLWRGRPKSRVFVVMTLLFAECTASHAAYDLAAILFVIGGYLVGSAIGRFVALIHTFGWRRIFRALRDSL